MPRHKYKTHTHSTAQHSTVISSSGVVVNHPSSQSCPPFKPSTANVTITPTTSSSNSSRVVNMSEKSCGHMHIYPYDNIWYLMNSSSSSSGSGSRGSIIIISKNVYDCSRDITRAVPQYTQQHQQKFLAISTCPRVIEMSLCCNKVVRSKYKRECSSK